MRHLTTLLVAVFMLFGITTSAQDDDRVFHCIVAQDGTGDCTNIQDAVDKAPEQSSKPYLIYIKAGRYHEHVYIPAEKPFLHFIGDSVFLFAYSLMMAPFWLTGFTRYSPFLSLTAYLH